MKPMNMDVYTIIFFTSNSFLDKMLYIVLYVFLFVLILKPLLGILKLDDNEMISKKLNSD
jgi:hypothetical protein